MANPSTPTHIGDGQKSSFTPSATEFAPKMVDSKREVLRASFVTQTVPNVPPHAGIVALCTVPEEKAGMEHLGWHIADFLAFRALLCGENNPKAQSWLAMCDIPTLARENPERYVHGKERRLVGVAASPTQVETPTGLVEREDNIQVETSAEVIKDKFIVAVKKKLTVLKKYGYPLFLIVCGLTSLEQDIYFGQLDVDHRYTMKEFREDLGNDINHIDVTVVTPSLFSAGWRINTSLGRPNSAEARGTRVEFLARQFGGLFAGDLVPKFLGWQCPAIDGTKIDLEIQSRERFPGPVVPSEEVKALSSQLEIKIQSFLLGESSAFPADHSFSFDKSKDEWDVLIRSRENQPDYRSLDWYERKWEELPSAQNPVSPRHGFEFLGSAYGGTKMSQLNHLRYLIEDSYLAWPDYWASTFGQETKKDFERFKITYNPDCLDCLEIFNILEHRARTSILGDAVIEYFDLPMPDNKRCRDCNVYKIKQQLPETARSSLISRFGTVLMSLPGPNVPPGVNPNSMSRLQQRLENCRGYIRASLAIRFLTSGSSSQIAIDRIENCMSS
ncbi:hypothetical protein F5B22DRAFT_316531 [Xylaria bambusicola]|uniref:uncharacterized protein n=1 Tax=Xylaria bambusicola TaxID=326684 RepID=UPI00200841AC|nr:uncharacterized protein F5B22DRAFT_316531 [Xylaria bambusicola]KAI0509573.1 hypothetical protein F5B22DRAFT_316531 [Xylaria bambusicola]